MFKLSDMFFLFIHSVLKVVLLCSCVSVAHKESCNANNDIMKEILNDIPI